MMVGMLPLLVACAPGVQLDWDSGSMLAAESARLAADARPDDPLGNVIIVVLDDVGVDQIGAYGVVGAAPTPTIDELVTEGVLFENAWSMPMCSPTRAALLTGRYPARTGIGVGVDSAEDEYGLQHEELTLPEVLAEAGYTTGAVGKWHLEPFTSDAPADHPLDAGFDVHRGPLGNPEESCQTPRVSTDYAYWERSEDGSLDYSSEYLTTATIDDAIDLMGTLPEPYALWVALNAPHTPFHEPPEELHTRELGDDPTDAELYDAMLEAADTELGRLLDELDDEERANTTVVVLGDNGTYGRVVEAPYDSTRAKATVYDGGVHVPFIVSGPSVFAAGATTDAFVSVVDLLPTLADLAGLDRDEILVDDDGDLIDLDGVSFAAQLREPDQRGARDHLYAEQFTPNGPPPYDSVERALRMGDYKLIWEETSSGTEELFFEYVEGAVDEGDDLLEGTLSPYQRMVLDGMRRRMTVLVDTVTM